MNNEMVTHTVLKNYVMGNWELTFISLTYLPCMIDKMAAPDIAFNVVKKRPDSSLLLLISLLHAQPLITIHTLQLNFLLSDWLFSKYAECIENVHCTPRTAPRLREVLLVRDLARERHIDWSIFFSLGKVVNILHVSGILKPFYI